MQRRPIMFAGLAGSAFLAGALLLGAGTLFAAPGKVGAVNIDNFSFGPDEVVVSPGTKVTWTNRDDIPHTVTDAADRKAFKSAPLDTGQAFSYVFASAGTYHYFCSLHPHMQGTVVVR